MSKDKSQDSPEQQEFRAYCRDWLKANHPGRPPVAIPQSAIEVSDPEAMAWLQAWQKSAYEAGLVGCDYSTDVGGGGRTDCQRIANKEMLLAQTPYFPNIVGLGMCAPTVYFHARDKVKADLLPKLFNGDDIWCQGYSEPGAGSDLASLQTFARRDGDNWIINGHKVWTTLAHFSSYMILLCRTDKADKLGGLSYIIVPIKSALGKGVTVRPLVKMTGETGFNEVIFEDLVVHNDFLMGEVGEGWKIAMETTLTHERGFGVMQRPNSGGMSLQEDDDVSTDSVESLIALAKRCKRLGGSAAEDPGIRDQLMKVMVRYEAVKQNLRRAGVSALTDHPMRLPLQTKLVYSEIVQDLTEIAYQIQGLSSSLAHTDPGAPDGGQWPLAYMNSFGMTISAGTSEVQRNILGERVLGLSKSK